MKWDGFRAIVSTEDAFCVRSPRGWNMAPQLPELRSLPRGLVLDGELVAFNGRQDPYFPKLCRRVLMGDRTIPVRFVVTGPDWAILRDVDDGHALYADGYSTAASGWSESRPARYAVGTQLIPSPLHSLRVAPGLSLKARRAMMAQSLEAPPAPVVRVSPSAGDRARDEKAWNLPRRSPIEPVARKVSHSTMEQDLDWEGFVAAYFPGSRRHSFKALTAYGDYKRSRRVDEDSATQAAQFEKADGSSEAATSVEAWENEGGTSQ